MDKMHSDTQIIRFTPRLAGFGFPFQTTHNPASPSDATARQIQICHGAI
jgi:hypothetical protein